MKPLCHELEDSEVARLGAMSPEDFAQAGVSKKLVPFVWTVAHRLLEARKYPNARMEATALGEHASWGRRGDRCSALDYLVRNIRKAIVREDTSARDRQSRPRNDRRTADYELIEGPLGDPQIWNLDTLPDLWHEPDETLDEFIARYEQEIRLLRRRQKK